MSQFQAHTFGNVGYRYECFIRLNKVTEYARDFPLSNSRVKTTWQRIRIITIRSEMLRRHRVSIGRAKFQNALKDLRGVVRRGGRKSQKLADYPPPLSPSPSIASGVVSYVRPRELRNQMANRTLRVPERPAGAHIAISIQPARQTHPRRNRVTYSSPSDPPALSRIPSSIRGVLFPTDNCISVHRYQRETWTLLVYTRIYLQSEGRGRMERIMDVGERKRVSGATVFIIAGDRPLFRKSRVCLRLIKYIESSGTISRNKRAENLQLINLINYLES